MIKERVLSGMQSSGRLHLGNLLGALENWVAMQESYECFYFVADWHAISTNYQDTSELRQNMVDIGVNWLAAGLNPEKSTLFVQSLVPQHAVLYVLLGMITPLPWLERMVSYKEKMENIKDRNLYTHGFLGYPVLQAADIMLYKANLVPVGQDQLQHLELTRDLVRHFHELYKKKVFVEPKAKMAKVKKLPGIDGRKMSKSYNNAIFLSDSKKDRNKKIMSIVTDPQRVRRDDKGNPDVCNVYAFHKIFTSAQRVKEIDSACRDAFIGCVDCKKELTKNLAERMGPFDEKRAYFEARKDEVNEILREGSAKAEKVAAKTLGEVENALNISVR